METAGLAQPIVGSGQGSQGAAVTSMERDGFVVVERILSSAAMARLQRVVDRLYRKYTRERFWFSELDRKVCAANQAWGGLPFAHFPHHRMLSGTIAELTQKLETLLGTSCVWQPSISAFRRLSKSASVTPWHNDAEAASNIRVGKNIFTAWLPLADVGISAPSIELIAGSHHHMRNDFGKLTEGRSDEYVAGVAGERITPVLHPGDAILFDQFTLHRTQGITSVDMQTRCQFRFSTSNQLT